MVVAVGTRITPRPPHGSRRAAFPHRALVEGRTSSAFGAGCPCSSDAQARCFCDMPIRLCVRDMRRLSPFLRPAAFPPPPPPLRTRQHCSALHRYYATVRLLAPTAAATPPRLPTVARDRISDCGRDEVSQVPAQSIRAWCGLRPRQGDSTLHSGTAHVAFAHVDGLGPCDVVNFVALSTHPSRLLCTLRGRRCRRLTQHSLPSGPLRPYPGRTFTGWTTPALPGAFRHSAQKVMFRWLVPKPNFRRATVRLVVWESFSATLTCGTRGPGFHYVCGEDVGAPHRVRWFW